MTDSAPSSTVPGEIRRQDYRPPAWSVPEIALAFDLNLPVTRVTATLKVRPGPGGGGDLVLDGEDLILVSLAVDGAPLAEDRWWRTDAGGLVITGLTGPATLTVVTEVRPADNTRLEGLYVSQGVFCTQCEAEGFRRITFFPDRPDVMAVHTVTLRADAVQCPVLLSNGNPVSETVLADGRRQVVWHDPFPKPSYLFALVAGDLACVRDHLTTAQGRAVALHLYVEHGREDRARWAMDSLIRAMRWDEDRFGLSYDLDRYNIVAVSSFNMGAMENKSLNIFNDRYILVDPETATDQDYENVEAVVAHEYFHNWTGNRVTCRDWFQLSLKEGLTVFRDQEFTADVRSRAVKRIDDVRVLRARQFPEDAGPLAHPVRPDSYVEINNFYTATVYEKGAELVRMLHTLLGETGFRRSMDLYFARHDGHAATCDDFLAAMADANGRDLSGFAPWYAQAGTPRLQVTADHDPAAATLTLTLRQSLPPTPGQPDKRPMTMPFALGLIAPDGRARPVTLAGEEVPGPATRVLTLSAAEHRFVFIDLPEPPVLSLNRGFSAPVIVESPQGRAEQAFLIAHDSDPFNRWEAAQRLGVRVLLDMAAAIQGGRTPEPHARHVGALGRVLEDGDLDPALAARLLTLPGEEVVAEHMAVADPEAIHGAREALRAALAGRLRPRLEVVWRANRVAAPYRPDPGPAGRRALRNAALALLSRLPVAEAVPLALEQYRAATDMTDRLGALRPLADLDHPEAEAALADFADRFGADPLVLDKWFALQAQSARPDTLERVRGLMDHPGFALTNPNRVRAVIGSFAMGNPVRFHAADGSGYRFVADRILDLDPLNPQIAARLLTAFGRWRRYDSGRVALMGGELDRIAATPGLSRDVGDIARRSLADERD